MTSWDDLWSGVALKQLEALPPAAQVQVDATVRQICAEPGGVGVTIGGEMPQARAVYAARAGSVLVLYQLDAIGEMVHILRLDYRG